ncbi:hypothetical protein AAZX31_06G026500 [Glycine max]|nr:hypothetical protein JHK87_014109 [Glycine soja]KHN22215.1 hypothetical protein glysoja_021971 [Glycine soja]
MAHMHGDTSTRVQILHSSPSGVSVSYAQLSTFFLSQANIMDPLQNPRRFRPRVQRHHPHPRTRLREIHCPLPPQHHRPSPRHHVVATNGRRAIRLDLRHGLGGVGGKEKTRPQ